MMRLAVARPLRTHYARSESVRWKQLDHEVNPVVLGLLAPGDLLSPPGVLADLFPGIRYRAQINRLRGLLKPSARTSPDLAASILLAGIGFEGMSWGITLYHSAT